MTSSYKVHNTQGKEGTMAATETSINVSKQSIRDLLSGGTAGKFLIPEYQRPYAWTADQVDTLLDDLMEYTDSIEDPDNPDSEYFLGSIVTYRNGKEREVIDGQQRLTTLFLLLRALYKKLENMDDPQGRDKNLMQMITPLLWVTPTLTGVPSRDQPLIYSQAISEEGSKTLGVILETGSIPPGADDNYAKNYNLIVKRLDEFSQEKPLLFLNFVVNLLQNVIVLPIDADSQDTALRIFNTLNDRGLPLSDADIFKSQMYKFAGSGSEEFSDSKGFIDAWKELEDDAKRVGVDMQTLFVHNMFLLRAKDNDRKTTASAARTYYGANNFDKLHNGTSLKGLREILNLWQVVNLQEPIDGESWSQNEDILQMLDILSEYPNDYWKYPTLMYYTKYRNDPDFESEFLDFLHRLTAELVGVYALTPTVNAIKQAVMNLDVEINNSPMPRFNFKRVNVQRLREELPTPHFRLVRLLLKVVAYLDPDQHELIPEKWEIEHIFPQKWENTNFPELADAEVCERIEHLGNKTALEKKLNIQASNGFFSRKRREYEKSAIAATRRIAEQHTEWSVDDILERDEQLIDLISNTLQEWGLNQTAPLDE